MPTGSHKKCRRNSMTHSKVANASPSTLTLTCLPLELLGEILLYTCSPPTVLAVSRTCVYLHRTLALNPSASFIWRGVRKTCKPNPLPDPAGVWKGTEAEYAAFVFDGGRCEMCRAVIDEMYDSFAARIRLCYKFLCRKRFFSHRLINITSIIQRAGHAIWIPCVESTRCFSPKSYVHTNWPEHRKILVRKSDWEKHKDEWNAYVAAEAKLKAARESPSQSSSSPVPLPLSERESADESQMQVDGTDATTNISKKYHAKMSRFTEIMLFSVELLQWKYAYEQALRDIKHRNEACATTLARQEGWDASDLMNSPAYSALHGHLNSLFETMTKKHFLPIRPTVEAQLLSMKEHRERREAEQAYMRKRQEIRSLYDSMKEKGTTVPPLHVFFDLPSVRAMRGRPAPVGPSTHQSKALSDLKDNDFAISLVTSDIDTWVNSVRVELLKELGFPAGWKSASSFKVDPLHRVTAKFLCTRCKNGGVNEQNKKKGCLDFWDVCTHVCPAKRRSRTIAGNEKQGNHESNADGGIEIDMADTGGKEANAPEIKKKRWKKKPAHLDWKVDVFKKDEKAILLINNVLTILGISAENHRTLVCLESIKSSIRCLSCTGWVTMDFSTAIEILSAEADATTFDPMTFQNNLASHLLKSSALTHNILNEANYGCRLCVTVDEDKSVQFGKGGARPMGINALRSHIKAKHEIEDLRDEDVFLYKPVDWTSGKYKQEAPAQ